MTTVLFLHGRSQESSDEIARDPRRLAAYVENKKRSWLSGLAKGLTLARQPGIDPGDVVYPFYGNTFAESIKQHEAAGGRRPELESVGTEQAPVADLKGEVLLNAATALGFDPETEMRYADPELAAQPGREGFADRALRIPMLRAALQFVSRKTGVPAVIIERFLEDVAYYLEVKSMRELVLGVVEGGLRARLPHGGDVVVVAHSLGTVVAYDLLTRLGPEYRVRQLVTAGSPLGYPVVRRNLLGVPGTGDPPVPGCVPRAAGAWLNAYDVADVVALIHPLADCFRAGAPGQLRDEITHNPSGPHSIEDYLSDPDIAGPIGRAVR